jgi:hypothetical protein
MPSLETKNKLQQVKINISFAAPKGKNPTLDELNSFLLAISNLHELTILSTQPEYLDSKRHMPLVSKVFDYHKLEVTQICRKNPFNLDISFYIIQEGLITYWPFIKGLMSFCNRYGKTSNNLELTLLVIQRFLNELYLKYYRNRVTLSLPSIFRIFEDETKLLEKLNSNFIRLISDLKFRKYYDFICSTSITITSLISTVEELNEKFDLMED